MKSFGRVQSGLKILCLLAGGFLIMAFVAPENDPFQWLEELKSVNSMSWVEAHNKTSFSQLTTDPSYQPTLQKIKNVLGMAGKLHRSFLKDDYAYQILQDATHIQGQLRRVKAQELGSAQPNWEIVLDLDQLSAQEKTTWLFQSMNCLPQKSDYCLMFLSADGRDNSEMREFNLVTKTFKVDGFRLPAARTDVAWVDENQLLVASTSVGEVTDSGFSSEVRLWARGQDLKSAPVVYKAPKTSMAANPERFENVVGPTFVISHVLSFYKTEHFLFDLKTGLSHRLPFPEAKDLVGLFHGHYIMLLNENFQVAGQTYKKGSLIALAIHTSGAVHVNVLFSPLPTKSVKEVHISEARVYVNVLDNIKSKVCATEDVDHEVTPVVGLSSGDSSVQFFRSSDTDLLYSEEGFLSPPTLKLASASNQVTVVQQVPASFDSAGLMSEQLHATSKDGTSIPYTVVRRKNAALDGTHPTILYGYGGFQLSMVPFYPSVFGLTWLSEGGIYVLANIRGGGEFGPEWHDAAILENKQKSYDDFIAIAEDLVQRKYTSPQHLGISGGSNGGLLVGAVTMQRPDLFAAALSANPLLDMIRYPEMSIGRTWVGEYGDPQDPRMREIILKYSPYQNILKERKYPKMLIMTATSDDRVHPGHARKFVAKMENLGHSVLFYENTSGGHGSATIEDQAVTQTLRMVYFYQQLGLKPH